MTLLLQISQKVYKTDFISLQKYFLRVLFVISWRFVKKFIIIAIKQNKKQKLYNIKNGQRNQIKKNGCLTTNYPRGTKVYSCSKKDTPKKIKNFTSVQKKTENLKATCFNFSHISDYFSHKENKNSKKP